MSNRYHFRPCPSGAGPPPAAQPTVPDSPLTRHSDVESNGGSNSPQTKSRVAASDSRSPAHTAGLVTASADALVAHTPPSISNASGVRKHPVTVEDATDEEARPWISVQRRRRARSADADLPARASVTAQDEPILTTPQRAAVDTAAAGLTPAERDHFTRCMAAVEPRRPRSQGSRGKGPSRDKGKTVDARNWGASGIPDEELDPDAQRREHEMYLSKKQNLFDGYNTDEQQAILEYWQAMKRERDSDREPTAATTPGVTSRSSSRATSHPSTPSDDEVSDLEPAPARLRSASQEQNRLLTEQLAAIQHELVQLRAESSRRKDARKKKKAAQKVRKPTEPPVTSKSAAGSRSAVNAHRGSSLRPVA
ncbi:hypothetical protein LXA43DRAFT_904532 [Ganoderma leucocontextum]|nr:hypothetical protein LXA43DRAFT_904532 [Ganoderma leucocontextum]